MRQQTVGELMRTLVSIGIRSRRRPKQRQVEHIVSSCFNTAMAIAELSNLVTVSDDYDGHQFKDGWVILANIELLQDGYEYKSLHSK